MVHFQEMKYTVKESRSKEYRYDRIMRNHEEMFSDCDELSEDENRVARTGILNKNRLITKSASSETNTSEKEQNYDNNKHK